MADPEPKDARDPAQRKDGMSKRVEWSIPPILSLDLEPGRDLKIVPLSDLDLADRRFQLVQTGDLAVLRSTIAAHGQIEAVDVMKVDREGPPPLLVVDGFAICEVLVELGIPAVRVRILAGLTLEQARWHAVCREVERLFMGMQAPICKAFGGHLRRRPVLRGRLDADDLAEELWLKALSFLFPPRCKPRTEDEISRLLGQMVLDVLLDAMKRHMRLKRTGARETHGGGADEELRAASPEDGPEHNAMRQEAAAAIEAALGKVSSEDQEVIVLVRLQGVPLPQAAQTMGLSLHAAKSRLRRGLDRLRLALLSSGC